MAVFKYRLQPLLDQKLRVQEDAEEALAQRKKELREAEAHLEELKRREQELIAKRENLRRGVLDTGEAATLTVDAVKKRVEYVKALGLDIDAARDDVFSQKMVIDECNEKVGAAQKHLLECQREVEILTKYRDKLEQRFRREQEQKEALELDEIGNVMYMTRRTQ
jgi:flagellar FliJ protein